MPGLLIIAITVLIISVFMVANSPISRLASRIGAQREHSRILKELEEDEKRRLTDDQIKAAVAADPSISAAPAEKKPFWKSVISGIIREEEQPEAAAVFRHRLRHLLLMTSRSLSEAMLPHAQTIWTIHR